MKFIGMTEEQKLTALQAMIDNGELKKGAYVKFSFKSIKKALKAYEKEHGETTIEKYTEGIVRLGIDYRNTNTYKQKCLTATPMVSMLFKANGLIRKKKQSTGHMTWRL